MILTDIQSKKHAEFFDGMINTSIIDGLTFNNLILWIIPLIIPITITFYIKFRKSMNKTNFKSYSNLELYNHFVYSTIFGGSLMGIVLLIPWHIFWVIVLLFLVETEYFEFFFNIADFHNGYIILIVAVTTGFFETLKYNKKINKQNDV